MKYQKGLSLIELMIALVIGLLLMAAVIQMFVGSRVTYSMQNELAKLQENARFAMNFISRDLRMSGYWGCKPHSRYEGGIANVLNGGEEVYNADWYQSLSVTDGGAASNASTPPDSDAITIKSSDSASSCTVDLDKTTAEYFFCTQNHAFSKGDILVASDCRHMAIFQMTKANNNDTNPRINHSRNEGGTLPGNCSKGLGLPVDCSSANGNEYSAWEPGTVIQRFNSYTYSVGENNFDPPQPALYRGSQELVEGVENMQVLLGFDTDDDGAADCFKSTVSQCSTINVTIDNVVSVRVSLVIRSLSDNVTSSPQSYELNGETIKPTDNYLRKVFTSTITLRNRDAQG